MDCVLPERIVVAFARMMEIAVSVGIARPVDEAVAVPADSEAVVENDVFSIAQTPFRHAYPSGQHWLPHTGNVAVS